MSKEFLRIRKDSPPVDTKLIVYLDKGDTGLICDDIAIRTGYVSGDENDSYPLWFDDNGYQFDDEIIGWDYFPEIEGHKDRFV